MAAIIDFTQLAPRNLPQADSLLSVLGIQLFPNFVPSLDDTKLSEQLSLNVPKGKASVTPITQSISDQPPSETQLPALALGLEDPPPLPIPELSVPRAWSLDAPLDVSQDPTRTEPDLPWTVFTDWLEPHMGPLPTYLGPAPVFPLLVPYEDPASGTLPTALPESMVAAENMEVVGTGNVVDQSHEWTFFDSGVVTVDGEILSPQDGVFAKWLPGDTYVGLFSDGLLVGSQRVPYPAEYLEWMAKHNIIILN